MVNAFRLKVVMFVLVMALSQVISFDYFYTCVITFFCSLLRGENKQSIFNYCSYNTSPYRQTL